MLYETNDTIDHLEKRLYELEWKLGTLNVHLNKKTLPHGMFMKQSYLTPRVCILEIRKDLEALKGGCSPRTAQYQVTKISEKINVLVRLCCLTKKEFKKERAQLDLMQGICTRQQQVESLQNELTQFQQQHDALLQRRQHLISKDEKLALSIENELGQLRRQITLAKEAVDKITAP